MLHSLLPLWPLLIACIIHVFISSCLGWMEAGPLSSPLLMAQITLSTYTWAGLFHREDCVGGWQPFTCAYFMWVWVSAYMQPLLMSGKWKNSWLVLHLGQLWTELSQKLWQTSRSYCRLYYFALSRKRGLCFTFYWPNITPKISMLLLFVAKSNGNTCSHPHKACNENVKSTTLRRLCQPDKIQSGWSILRWFSMTILRLRLRGRESRSLCMVQTKPLLTKVTFNSVYCTLMKNCVDLIYRKHAFNFQQCLTTPLLSTF